MESVLQRVASFIEWPINSELYPTLLADVGFFSTGSSGEIECFRCHIKLNNLSVGDNPVLKHNLVNPNCQLIAHKQVFNVFSNRFVVPKTPLYKDGANFNGDENGEPADRQDGLTHAILPTIPTDNYQQLASLPLTMDYLKSAANASEFKSNKSVAAINNDMKFEKCRLDSFLDWPKNDVIKPQLLAKDGFFYMGTGDRVQCAFCKGILRTWEPGDDPEVEHTRHYPECGFVQGNDVGNVPITVDPRRKANVIRDELNRVGTIQSKFSIDAREIKARLDTPQVRLLEERGYSMDIIRLVLEERLRNHGLDFPNIADFIRAVSDKKTQIEAAVVSQRKAQQGIGALVLNTNQQSSNVAENKKEFGPAKSVLSTIPENTRVLGVPTVSAITTLPPSSSSGAYAHASAGSSSNIAAAAAKNIKHEVETEKHFDEKSSKVKKKKKKNKKAGKNAANNKIEDDETAEESVSGSQISLNVTVGPKESNAFTSDDSHLCAICQDREINTAFIPCGHASTCDNCSVSLKSCPMCRKPIEERFRIYLS